jgi:hypothetical protein
MPSAAKLAASRARSAAPTRAAQRTSRLIGARAARRDADGGAAVGTGFERALRQADDVGHHVADDEDAGAAGDGGGRVHGGTGFR